MENLAQQTLPIQLPVAYRLVVTLIPVYTAPLMVTTSPITSETIPAPSSMISPPLLLTTPPVNHLLSPLGAHVANQPEAAPATANLPLLMLQTVDDLPPVTQSTTTSAATDQ